ncbi:hypothetical protein [Oceanimonas smirnovii]|uniref:hypothetical protein n=1 Tax=Oceanimonas smirnovii TaxID=264574 RepID=UPI00376F6389
MNNLISLKIENNKLFVDFKSDLNNNNEYAFYLYKNNIKEAVKWYSTSNSTVFELTGGGSYKVKAFLRTSAGVFLNSFLSEDLPYNIPIYDTSKWGEDVVVDIDEFITSSKIPNGFTRVSVGNEHIDILVDGIERLNTERGILVCFTGAVPKRENKSAPFFSGLNIAKNLNAPLISISDPSLARSKKLALAWYAGNENIKDLPFKIAKILDHISSTLKTKLVLFGGSGGGFAVLSVIEKMTHEAYGAVWNPQTSITRYNKKKAVLNYMETCFSGFIKNSNIYTYLENLSISHDLTRSYKPNNSANTNKSILYLQNQGDIPHVERHALPFMSALSAKKECENIFSTSNGVFFWFNYWGDGHLVPCQKVIKYVLGGLLDSSSPLDIAYQLNRGII